MKHEIRHKPSFGTVFVTLEPGESMTAEAGAMASMAAQTAIKTKFSGGFFQALMLKFFGGESLFVNVFSNPTQKPLEVVLTQSTVGDVAAYEVSGKGICLQPGAYIAHTPGVKLGVEWAGFSSYFSGEGLFKLKLTGQGTVFFGAYGGLTKKQVSGEFIVDTGHLVAYEPGFKMNLKLAGGLLGSMTSGEGLVNRMTGNGTIFLQSRSTDGLVSFLRSKVP